MKSLFKKIKDIFFTKRSEKVIVCKDNYEALPETIGWFKLSKEYQIDRAGLYFDLGGTNKSMLLIIGVSSFSYRGLEIEGTSTMKFVYGDYNSGLQNFLELKDKTETIKNKILNAEKI